MRWLWLTSIIAMMLLTLAGCHRQGAVTDTTASKLSRNSPQIGEIAEYSLNGKTTLAGSTAAVYTTGHARYEVMAALNRSRGVPSHIIRSFDIHEDITHNTGGLRKVVKVIVWIGEDASGNLYLLGESPDGRNWDFVIDNAVPLYMPAEIKTGSAWQYTANFGSGNRECVAYRCLGTERMKTPAGEYDAHRLGVRITHTREAVADCTGYVWLSPDLPFVFELKSEYYSSEPIQGILHNTELVSSLETVKRAR